jgi:formylglycine-generating enzyme required for sulfatase activity
MGTRADLVEMAIEIAGGKENISHNVWEWDRVPDESPEHRVGHSRPYLIGATEVTIGQYATFVEATNYVTENEQQGGGFKKHNFANEKVVPASDATWRSPGYPVTDESPVAGVTWNDAVEFCNWLSEKEGFKPLYRPVGKKGWVRVHTTVGYRLPSEAEWEFACRAGTDTQYCFGDNPLLIDKYAWYSKNSADQAHPVGEKEPNAFDLHDMHGNLFEWCHDWYAPDYYSVSPPNDPCGPPAGAHRSVRGGYYFGTMLSCRSSFRHMHMTDYSCLDLGFRVVRTIPRPHERLHKGK